MEEGMEKLQSNEEIKRKVKEKLKEEGKEIEVTLDISKIKEFFKSKKGIAIAVLVASLISRLILVNLNSGVWWDGASFIIESLSFFNLNPCNYELHRLPGFALALLPFSLTKNLILIRFWIAIISSLSILATYLLSRRFFNVRYSLLVVILLIFSWLHLFYSLRILPHTFALLLVSLSYYLYFLHFDESCEVNKRLNMFFKRYKIKDGLIILSSLILGFYYSVRSEAIAYILSLVFFSLLQVVNKKMSFKLLAKQVVFILIPIFIYQIYQYLHYGSFFFQEKLNYDLTKYYGEDFFWYFTNINHIFGNPILVFLLLLSLIVTSYYGLKVDSKFLFLPLTFIILIILHSFSPHHEDRYLIPLFSVAFPLIVSNFYIIEELLKNLLKNYSIYLYYTFLGIILILSIFSLIYGIPILISKSNTYDAVIKAGKFLHENYPNKAVITTVMDNGNAPIPQLCLFAGEREYIPYGSNLKETLKIAKENNALIYYSTYDANINYLSPFQFYKIVNNTYYFNQSAFKNWLIRNNLSVAYSFQDASGGLVILYEVRKA